MKPKKIVVLFGGKTGEHEVSLRSAAAIVKNMDPELWEPVGIGIDYDGRWYLQDSASLYPKEDTLTLVRNPDSAVSVVPGRGLFADGEQLECACVFPALHGTFGEDGTLQGLMEITGLPYAGSDVLGSSLGMDKEMTKRIWQEAGLPVVPFITADAEETESLVSRIENSFGFPVFIKPVHLGSSVGVSRAANPLELERSLDAAFRFDTRVILEPEISGREIECAVLGNHTPRAYGPGEVAPSHEFYSYEAKYIDPDGADLIIPALLPEPDLETIRDLAVRAFLAVKAQGLSRVDFFYENNSNRILLNEINTLPGFTSISMFPRMCIHGGISFRDLVTEIIHLGIERFNERKNLQFRHT